MRFAQNQLLVDELRTRINIGEAEAITLADEVKATPLTNRREIRKTSGKRFGIESYWCIRNSTSGKKGGFNHFS